MSDILQTILSRADLHHSRQNSESDFLTVLLQQSVADLGLERLGVWIQDGDSCRLIAQYGDDSYAPPSREQICDAPTGGLRVLTSQNGSSVSSARHLLTATQVASSSRVVLEAGEGHVSIDDEVILQLTDVIADLHRRRLLDSLLEHSREQSAWQTITTQVHSSLDRSVIANTIVTDMAAVLSCRRIAVVHWRNDHWSLVATTGVSQPDPRSDVSVQICRWVEAAAAQAPAADRRPFVRPLNQSVDWQDAEWAIVIEADSPLEANERLDRFLRHAAMALANSDVAGRRGAFSTARRWGGALLRPTGALLVVLCVCAAVILFFIQTDLRIEVYGELVPTNRRFVFAPEDGTVTELFVKEDSEVSEQDVLCVLTNEDLNGQAEAIDGELAAVNARLAALETLRGTQRSDSSNAQLLSAERAELEQKMKSLTKQSQILSRRLQQLHIKPGMNGRIYGDRLRQLLFQRPVQRGQFLMEVADPAAGWQLHLRVPEADARYVLSATHEADPPAVSFSLETSPDVIRHTTLASLGAATDVDVRGTLSTLAIAELMEDEFVNERPGAGVVAKVHCGRRSLGFVWFRRVIEFLQRHTWL